MCSVHYGARGLPMTQPNRVFESVNGVHIEFGNGTLVRTPMMNVKGQVACFQPINRHFNQYRVYM